MRHIVPGSLDGLIPGAQARDGFRTEIREWYADRAMQAILWEIRTMSNVFRNIPSVNELLDSPPLRTLVERVNRNVVVSGVRDFLDNLRSEVPATAADIQLPSARELAERIAQWILYEERPSLRPVINATGILLHTGLGRAPLAAQAIDAMVSVSRDYASVEMDLTTGQRSHRVVAVSRLLCKLTGAEAAAVVNNNAGATLITLAATAAGKEVIVSRGQLVEIGGSYRLPDVMETSGARLREVGTTNRTRIEDYERAIGPDTAALMRVHTSNYVVQGFTQETPLAELVALGKQHHLPVIDDIGSGALWDYAQYNVGHEPSPLASIHAGADVALMSGDKLLGGPQCGIIIGRRELIDRITRHPLARALRVDKITLAALAATLRLYQNPDQLEQQLPLVSLLATPLANLQNRAERLATQLAAAAAIQTAEAIRDTTYLGGGALPTQKIDTWCVALEPARTSTDALAAKLRGGPQALCGRVQNDRLLLDLRTVFPRQDADIVRAIGALNAKNDETHDTETSQSESD